MGGNKTVTIKENNERNENTWFSLAAEMERGQEADEDKLCLMSSATVLSLRSFPRIDINSTKQRPLLAAAAAVTITNKQSKMKLVSSSLLYVKSN